ncbi:ribonuclease R [Parasphingorhabdus halotolerans]|uniref:Ribonuclease R n=1 Tax=Parasphingorhabdus halotolerans TaxID=2725558 RepID=A0A6H2DJW0_9SPHN|nr:ribonuclease R [Parasphingorhabdus halotolerans]QJB68273.1 ribonuclease R [Parasphingorhabdus halotolerans]
MAGYPKNPGSKKIGTKKSGKPVQKKRVKNPNIPGAIPSRKKILDFIAQSEKPAGKREIAKAFGLRGSDKIALKALLKDMADEGLIDASPGRAFHKMGGVPKVTVLKIVEIDGNEAIAVPDKWEADDTPAPKLRIKEKGRRAALAIGDRILARTEERGQGHIAYLMKKLAEASEMLMGIVEKDERDRFWLKPVDRKIRRSTPISDLGEAKSGDLVRAEPHGRGSQIQARVKEVLGDPFAPKSFSLIAIGKFEIPDVFPDNVLAEAEQATKLELGTEKREDLRHLPIVAIDPADARDHDDAIWATPDDDPDNKGGYKALIAIADVSYYVRTGSALDREAYKRGNSVYFPDRVVPMLPEALSTDVCSLKQDVDRAALVCHLQIDAKGKMRSSRFTRAIVKLAGNIAYEDAQAAIDGRIKHPLTSTALKPVWDCWKLLAKARDDREPLHLDLPEKRVVLDEQGRIAEIAVRERLDAHRVVEDFMIAANVAAAKMLESKKSPLIYRVHEVPSREKLIALKDYLKSFDVSFAMGQVIKPSVFNRLIEQVGEAEILPLVMEQILRSQTQAYYGHTNMGHFGLSLGSYAHFTSPIRRYADLIVHRALVSACKLEQPKPANENIPASSGLSEDEAGRLELISEKISQLERRAMKAERETVDRYISAHLSERVGQILKCRITGVQNFGFFATVEELGGDGLVPVRTLGSDYYEYDEASQELKGQKTGETYNIGQKLELRLIEANPATGSLLFELPEGGNHSRERPSQRRPGQRKPPKSGQQHKKGKRGRPANIKHNSRKK